MKVLTDNQYYGQIADVIREQNGTNNTYTPPQMVRALKDLFYEEVEGVPPITFQGIGENLLDYRIDGASGGVGDRTKNFINSNKQATYYNTTFKIEGSKVTLTGTPTGAGGKNSLCTDSILLSAGTYIFSNTNPNIGVQIVDESSNNNLSNPFTLTEEKNVHIGVYIKQSQVGIEFNEVDYWQLEEGSIATDYEPYGYKVPVVVSGKNLLRNTAATQTINGVTFTVNDDGSVTCNGTANETVRHMLGGITLMSGVQYKMSGCPTNGANNTYRLDPRLMTGSVIVSFIDNGNGAVYTPNADVRINVGIYIQNGYTCDNLTFYPMIRLITIEDDTYEPYHESTTTNIYLDEPILENESISLSDTNTNIPTIRGTNVLTVDTTVQPSNVYIKSRHESSYETIMRERYEEAQAQLDALN